MNFKSGSTLLFIGDSITDCGRTNHLPPFGGGYMNMFRNIMLAEYPDMILSFINNGISGNTLKGLELRWQHDVFDHLPDHLFIMIGINDAAMQLESSRDLKIVLDEFEHTYEKLMKESIEKGMIIHCMTPFYIDSSTSRPFDSPSPLLQLTLRYIDRIKIVCDRLNIPLLNIHDIFQDKLRQSEANYWSSDGVHPYEHGHMLIAKELFKWVINEN